MPRRDPTADAIARLAALRTADPATVAAGLPALLADKASYVVGRAAELAADQGARALLPRVIEAFTRLLGAAASKDVGCAAKTALARAIVRLEAGHEAESALLAGARHAHWEATWGGQADLAVGVRGQSVIGLAAMASRSALRSAAELLAESDMDMQQDNRERVSWPARADAARALTMIGTDGAAALLRFKAALGDPEPAVVCDCLAGVIAIEPDDGFELAEQFLSRKETAEAALLAIGGTRRPAAFDILKRNAARFLRTGHLSTFVNAVSLTRQDAAIDYLLCLAGDPDREISAAAIEALTPMRALQRIGERLDEAITKRS